MLICLRLCINIRSFIKARFDLFFPFFFFFQSYELIYSKYSLFCREMRAITRTVKYYSFWILHSASFQCHWKQKEVSQMISILWAHTRLRDWEILSAIHYIEIKSTSSFSQPVRQNWFKVQVEDFGINLILNLTSHIISLHIYGIDLESLFRIKWLLTVSNCRFTCHNNICPIPENF